MNTDDDKQPSLFDKATNLDKYKFTLLTLASVCIFGLAIYQEPKTTVPLLFGALAGGGIVASRKN